MNQQSTTEDGEEVRRLRRPYTRTIPKDLRDVGVLEKSFIDVQLQWMHFTLHYKTVAERSSDATKLSELIESREVAKAYGEVGGMVSQLKAIKQELLSHLNTLKGKTFTEASRDADTPGALSTEAPTWITCLCRSDSTHQTMTQQMAYLDALWLARQVWVWSICFACVTVDLELLTGSISVATDLFFGTPSQPNLALRHHQRLSKTLPGREPPLQWAGNAVTDTFYSLHGRISEEMLYTHRYNRLSTTLDAAAVAAQLRREECSAAAFFLPCTPHTSSTAATFMQGKGSSGLPGHMRDSFCVYTAALFYAIIVRDDVTATRHMQCFTAVPTEPNPLLSTAVSGGHDEMDVWGKAAQNASRWVADIASLLAAEDYLVANSLICMSWVSGNSDIAAPRPAAAIADSSARVSMAGSGACLGEEGLLFCGLMRLLAEHVIRRRFVAANMHEIFRPIITLASNDGSGSAGRCSGLSSVAPASPNAHAVETSSSFLADHLIKSAPNPLPHFRAQTVEVICALLQQAALKERGGPWPMPGFLLRAVFGSV